MTPTLACPVGIVGTGRVARALALAVARIAAEPPLIRGRSDTATQAAAAASGAMPADSWQDLVTRCRIVILAVADAALAEVAVTLAQPGSFTHAPLFIHVSGASGEAVLAPLRANGALTAAVHPAMTFTGDPEAEAARMTGARFAVTAADPQARTQALALVEALGGVPVEIAEGHRPLYHAALSHASNHLVTLISGAGDALRAAGVEEPGALMAPLVRAALENVLAQGFAALSGPVLRGDADTVARHLAVLGEQCPQVLPAYRAMAAATLDTLELTGRARHPGAMRRVLAD